MSDIFSTISNSKLNQTFNIDSPFTIMSPMELKEAVPMSKRGGSLARYPWYELEVGQAFFKAASKEDVDRDKGRPGAPESLKERGIVFKITKIYNKVKKQYGYQALRIS